MQLPCRKKQGQGVLQHSLLIIVFHIYIYSMFQGVWKGVDGTDVAPFEASPFSQTKPNPVQGFYSKIRGRLCICRCPCGCSSCTVRASFRNVRRRAVANAARRTNVNCMGTKRIVHASRNRRVYLQECQHRELTTTRRPKLHKFGLFVYRILSCVLTLAVLASLWLDKLVQSNLQRCMICHRFCHSATGNLSDAMRMPKKKPNV